MCIRFENPKTRANGVIVVQRTLLFRVFFFLLCLSAFGSTLPTTRQLLYYESSTCMVSSMLFKSFNTLTIHLAVFVVLRDFFLYNFLLLFRFLLSLNTFDPLYSFDFQKDDDICYYVLFYFIFFFKLSVRFSVTI